MQRVLCADAGTGKQQDNVSISGSALCISSSSSTAKAGNGTHRSMRWIDFSWHSWLMLPSSEIVVPLLCVDLPLEHLSPNPLAMAVAALPGSGTTWLPFLEIQLWNPS